MNSKYIIEVSEADFPQQVVEYSLTTPVIVDFWATWCAPCRVLSPILESLAIESGGSFRLAKLDIDQNPNITRRYNITSVPVVKAFRDSHVVGEFVGVQSDAHIRAFLRRIAPSQVDLHLEKGNSLYNLHEYTTAEEAYQQVLKTDNQQPGALLGLAKIAITKGKIEKALKVLRNFPASREFTNAQTLIPLAEELKRSRETTYPDDYLAIAYFHVLRLIQLGNYPAALDGLLGVMRQDKHYKDEIARKVVLGIFELLGEEDALVKEYRQELAAILF